MLTASERSKISTRMCAGCGQRTSPDELVRLVVGPSPPYVAVDIGRKLQGRGVSVHPKPKCVREATARGGLAKALRGIAEVEPESVIRMIVAQYEQRLVGLLTAAARRRRLAIGTEAVRSALHANRGDLLIRAKDGRGRVEELARTAVARGCATTTWGAKAVLGKAFDRDELGVLLVMDRGIARAALDCSSRVEVLSEDG